MLNAMVGIAKDPEINCEFAEGSGHCPTLFVNIADSYSVVGQDGYSLSYQMWQKGFDCKKDCLKFQVTDMTSLSRQPHTLYTHPP